MFAAFTPIRAQSKKGRKNLQDIYLHSVITSDIPLVQKCLSKGVDPNARTETRATALHIAAEKGDIPLGKLLLSQKNIKLNLITNHSYTPLTLCTLFNKGKFVKLLLQKGANPNIPDRLGITPLHIAAKQKFFEIMKDLIQYKANVNVLNCFYITPLATAIIESRDRNIAEFLLSNNANIDVNRGGAIHVYLESVLNCFSVDQINMILLILEYVDVNLVDPLSKRNCLHFVAISGYLPLADVLLERGADRDFHDKLDKTPMMVAKEHEHYDLVDLFQNRYRKPNILTVTSYARDGPAILTVSKLNKTDSYKYNNLTNGVSSTTGIE